MIENMLEDYFAIKNNVEKEYSKIREESKFERISSKIFYCVIIASGFGMIVCQLIGYEIGMWVGLAIAELSAICLGIGEKCETKEWKKEAVEKEKNIARELMNILRQHYEIFNEDQVMLLIKMIDDSINMKSKAARLLKILSGMGTLAIGVVGGFIHISSFEELATILGLIISMALLIVGIWIIIDNIILSNTAKEKKKELKHCLNTILLWHMCDVRTV